MITGMWSGSAAPPPNDGTLFVEFVYLARLWLFAKKCAEHFTKPTLKNLMETVSIDETCWNVSLTRGLEFFW